jgi:hypothetical protein
MLMLSYVEEVCLDYGCGMLKRVTQFLFYCICHWMFYMDVCLSMFGYMHV